ncbi:MAG: hypothetical protein E7Z89_07095 [Cyanobacteria bacterium SIG28]|nr:hypothetical protein [Cyanobacteria bacterium SIG28]
MPISINPVKTEKIMLKRLQTNNARINRNTLKTNTDKLLIAKDSYWLPDVNPNDPSAKRAYRHIIGGMTAGAAAGAAIGSVVPIVGTVLGAFGGAIAGTYAGSVAVMVKDYKENKNSEKKQDK